MAQHLSINKIKYIRGKYAFFAVCLCYMLISAEKWIWFISGKLFQKYWWLKKCKGWFLHSNWRYDLLIKCDLMADQENPRKCTIVYFKINAQNNKETLFGLCPCVWQKAWKKTLKNENAYDKYRFNHLCDIRLTHAPLPKYRNSHCQKDHFFLSKSTLP